MHILIAGGSGFLGTYLSQHLASHGHEITILSRNPEKTEARPNIRIVYWDGKKVMLPSTNQVDAVVNLCGLSIARYWSQAAKKNIQMSRVEPTRALVRWVQSIHPKPVTMVQISGIDYYDINTPECHEGSPPGTSFLAQMAQAWEQETAPLHASTTRLIIARLAPVFAKTHPPLKPLIQTTQLGIGCIIGTGTQHFSWIHHQDFTDSIRTMLENNHIAGVFNLCAPSSVPYAQLMQTLATHYNRPLWLKMPAWVLEKTLGEMATLIVDSRRICAKKIQQFYTFKHPTLQHAITALDPKV